MSRYSYKTVEQSRNEKKARRENHRKLRAVEKKKSVEKSARLLLNLRDKMTDSHFTPTQISDFSGVDPATILRVKRNMHYDIRLITFIGLANACGYELQLVKKPLADDEFKEHRFVRLVESHQAG